MGKRVDFCARSVISPDPYINLDELGVPLQIAMGVTIPEYITKYNIDKMQKLCNNGGKMYPGANYVRV